MRLSRVEKTGETEPSRLKSVKSSEITLPWRHLIPVQKQTELEFEESQFVNEGFGLSNPCLRVSKASKSEAKTGEVDEKKQREMKKRTVKLTKYGKEVNILVKLFCG